MMAATRTRATTTTPSKILFLYKQCLRSAQRIPELDQRDTYQSYIRQGFRDVKQGRQAVMAMKDAEEQLERMDYYHSIREQSMRLKMTESQKKVLPSSTCTEVSATAAPRPDTASQTSTATIRDTSILQQWILEAIPDLHEDDVHRYAQQLSEDGFDSPFLLQKELKLNDLFFMKKGHLRALVRAHGISDK